MLWNLESVSLKPFFLTFLAWATWKRMRKIANKAAEVTKDVLMFAKSIELMMLTLKPTLFYKLSLCLVNVESPHRKDT